MINNKQTGPHAAPRRDADQPKDRTGAANRLTDECQMLRAAKQTLERRRLREAEFRPTFFGEPAWEMLLELYIRDSSGASTTTAHLQAGSGSPPSTVLRWLQQLERENLVIRYAHPVDHGTDFVELTDEARDSLERYLAATRQL